MKSDKSLAEVILDGGMTRSERRRKGKESKLVGKRIECVIGERRTMAICDPSEPSTGDGGNDNNKVLPSIGSSAEWKGPLNNSWEQAGSEGGEVKRREPFATANHIFCYQRS